MKKLILIITLVAGITVFGQDNKTSATLTLPFTTKPFSYSDNLNLGLQYRFIEAGPVVIGVSTNFSYLQRKTQLGSTTAKLIGTTVQPRVFGELNIPAIEKLKPSLALGYTWINYKSKIAGQSSKTDEKGFNMNIGLSYYMSDSFFLIAHLDRSRLVIEYEIVDLSSPVINNFKEAYWSNLLNIGVGFRF